MKTFICSAAIGFFMLLSFPSAGNYIQIENGELVDQVVAEHYVYIQFDLSQEHSWRTSGVPGNWDAAWVFCKYRVVGGEWHHASLHYAGHTAPSGVTIDVPEDTTGAFIYRSTNGSGNIDWDGIRLRWDYGYDNVNDDAMLEVKIFAIEMVYVPGGTYYLGDGVSDSCFYAYPNQVDYYQVSSEDAISTGQTTGYLWADFNLASGSIPAAYPKGYDAFYVMKYEISQAMYTEFLNCLTRTQQDARTATVLSVTYTDDVFVMTQSQGPILYNGIRCDNDLSDPGPVVFWGELFTGDGGCLPCNFLAWPDIAAYLDWAGLRPMTELEYEKACRGPNYPVAGEYAWGNTLINVEESGYDVMAGASCSSFIDYLQTDLGNCLYELTQLSEGEILRCGLFAGSVSTNNRTSTGAAYYGMMEMTGNVWEYCVNAKYNAGWSYTGLHGDGELDNSGNGNVDYWPGMEGNNNDTIANVADAGSGISGYGGACAKGGHFGFLKIGLPVSQRHLSGSTYSYSLRNEYAGGRGIRTAP